MKTAVISDIHGNSAALGKVLRDIKAQKCDRIVCLGDIVGYGYDPNGCVGKIRKVCGHDCAMGNHDAAVLGKLDISWFNSVSAAGVRRDMEKITDATREYLDSETLEIYERPGDGKVGVCFTHGSIHGKLEFPYVQDTYDASFAMETMKDEDVQLMFVGHTHEAIGFQLLPKTTHPNYHTIEEGTVYVDRGTPTIVNVGSVGYPRNQPFSCYAIYDDEQATVDWRKVDFDFKGYCKKMKEHKIPVPRWMYRWVDEGYLTEDEAFGED